MKSLSTRIYRAYFSNAKQATEIKVGFDSNSNNLKFKVFTREKQKTSEPVCDGKEGSTLNSNSGSVSTKVTNETELVIFVANTDFVNPSSFTVTVEAVGKPGITVTPPAKLTTPIGPSISGNIIIENTGAIGSTLEYQVYQASQSSVDITSFNNRVVSTALSAKNGLRSAALPSRGFPSAPPADVWDGGTVSVSSGVGSMEQGAAPALYSVTATCTKPGSHTAIVPIVYYTGEFDSRNVEQVVAADVRVEIECMATEEGMGLDRGFNYVDPVTGFKNVTTLDDPGCPGNDYDATIEFSRIISFFAANTYRFEQVFNRTFKCVLETDIRCFGCYSVAGGVQYGATERHVQIYSELYNAYTAWAYGKLDEMLASHSENHPEYKYFSPYVDFGKSPKICAGTTDYCYQPIKFVVFRVFR